LLKPQNTARTLVHVYPDAKELGKVWPFRLGIPAGLNATAAALAGLTAVPARHWEGWCKELRKQYSEDIQPPPMPGRLNLAEAIKTLQATLEPDAILVIGAGNFMGWPIRFYQYQKPHTQLSLTVGAMGYSVPAAVAAKLCYPKRQVVSFAGDGCFLMNGQELATARRHGLKIVFFVVNNGMYGTIRMHQERHYPGRAIATDLTNPDFALLAEAYGLLGMRVEKTQDFAPALERALSANGPALIELMLEPEAISIRGTLSGLKDGKGPLSRKGPTP
jgi:acetolactate synthase-1/2/3 large subunit